MTSHNRAPFTVKSLEHLLAACTVAGIDAEVFLCDAGSSDGTLDRAREIIPGLHVVPGDKDVFWARGMALAEKAALDHCQAKPTDYLLWLNDDVFVDRDSLQRVLPLLNRGTGNQVLVGALRTSEGAPTVGGLRQSVWNPAKFFRVEPTEENQFVDTVHGNFLLVSVARALELGGIDSDYGHHLADIDYGLRNAKSGGQNVLLPGTFGVCDEGQQAFGGLADHWAFYRSIKGSGYLPARKRFLKRHGFWFSPIQILVEDSFFFVRLIFRYL